MTEKERRILSLARNAARELEESKAWSGSRDDGGAGYLREAADAWEAGLRGVVPARFQRFASLVEQELKRERDPDFAEYCRLRSKFG